jgi:hypothetical protein
MKGYKRIVIFQRERVALIDCVRSINDSKIKQILLRHSLKKELERTRENRTGLDWPLMDLEERTFGTFLRGPGRLRTTP